MDYEPLTGVLIFNRTITKHTVNVSLINDNETEQSETFFARLMLVSPLVELGSILLSPNQIEVEIKDDDGKNCFPSLTHHFDSLVIIMLDKL